MNQETKYYILAHCVTIRSDLYALKYGAVKELPKEVIDKIDIILNAIDFLYPYLT